MDSKQLCVHTQMGYNAIQIKFDYTCIGYTFREIKMVTETGYNNINIGFN